jgi:hypothetical protein
MQNPTTTTFLNIFTYGLEKLKISSLHNFCRYFQLKKALIVLSSQHTTSKLRSVRPNASNCEYLSMSDIECGEVHDLRVYPNKILLT